MVMFAGSLAWKKVHSENTVVPHTKHTLDEITEDQNNCLNTVSTQSGQHIL